MASNKCKCNFTDVIHMGLWDFYIVYYSFEVSYYFPWIIPHESHLRVLKLLRPQGSHHNFPCIWILWLLTSIMHPNVNNAYNTCTTVYHTCTYTNIITFWHFCLSALNRVNHNRFFFFAIYIYAYKKLSTHQFICTGDTCSVPFSNHAHMLPAL